MINEKINYELVDQIATKLNKLEEKYVIWHKNECTGQYGRSGVCKLFDYLDYIDLNDENDKEEIEQAIFAADSDSTSHVIPGGKLGKEFAEWVKFTFDIIDKKTVRQVKIDIKTKQIEDMMKLAGEQPNFENLFKKTEMKK